MQIYHSDASLARHSRTDGTPQPHPAIAQSPQQEVIFTAADVENGQVTYLGRGGQHVGSVWGHGIPGLIFSPLIGKAVDRWGRRWLIAPGLAMAALAGLAMIAQIPPIATTSAILILSLGYDFTQPLFVGIVTDLGDGHSLGQTMGLKVFTLFTGFGLGSWVFGEALRWGFGPTLMVFGGLQLVAAIAAIPLFWNEKPRDFQLQASD